MSQRVQQSVQALRCIKAFQQHRVVYCGIKVQSCVFRAASFEAASSDRPAATRSDGTGAGSAQVLSKANGRLARPNKASDRPMLV